MAVRAISPALGGSGRASPVDRCDANPTVDSSRGFLHWAGGGHQLGRGRVDHARPRFNTIRETHMTFVARQIIVTVKLQERQGAPFKNLEANPNPTFKGTNSNTVRIVGGGTPTTNGLRIAARISNAGMPSFAQATLQIYNLPLEIINQVGTLGTTYIHAVGANIITIEAGDVGKQPTKIFQGVINSAYGDFSMAPDVVFCIAAQAIGVLAAAPAQSIGYKGATASGTIFANLAKQAGLTLVNRFSGGVTPTVYDHYLSGSLRDQIKDLAQAANVACNVDDVNGTLVIGPTLGSLSAPGEVVPIIAPPPLGSMVGYPSYTQTGIRVTNEFTTAIGYGTTVRVKGSQLQNANGEWVAYYVDHDLECQAHNGPWFTNIEARKFKIPALLPMAVPTGA